VVTVQDCTSEAIFGAADGMVSLIGLVAGAMVAHASPAALLTMAGGAATAAMVSMAGGDWLAGKSVRLSAVMGGATLLGSLVPVLPIVLIPGLLGVLVAITLTVLMGVGIAEARAQATGPKTDVIATDAHLLVGTTIEVADGGSRKRALVRHVTGDGPYNVLVSYPAGRLYGYATTFGVLVVASGVAIAVSVLLGAAG
jgi:hypothetical protein